MPFQNWSFLFVLIGASISLKGGSRIPKANYFGKTKFYTMVIDASTVNSLKSEETLYFTINYDGITIGKDKVLLNGYRHTKGEEVTTPFPLTGQYEKVKLSFNKKFATYKFPIKAYRDLFSSYKNKGIIGSILLTPIEKDFTDGYVRYQISFLKDKLPFTEKEARIPLEIMDPCPPKACSTIDD